MSENLSAAYAHRVALPSVVVAAFPVGNPAQVQAQIDGPIVI
jgi:hypothetical protein